MRLRGNQRSKAHGPTILRRFLAYVNDQEGQDIIGIRLVFCNYVRFSPQKDENTLEYIFDVNNNL